MPKKKKVSKKPTPKDVLADWKHWKSQATSKRGRAIGLGRSNMSLYDAAAGHGKIRRKAGKKRMAGMGKLLDRVNSVLRGKSELSDQDIAVLRRTLREADRIGDQSESNPRNVVFTAITGLNKANEPNEWEEYYGHWNSHLYKKGMRLKIKAKDNTKSYKGIKHHPAWSSKTMGTAKPPLWQVFFIEEGDSLGGAARVIDKGLFPILKDVLDLVELDHLELDISSKKLERQAAFETIGNLSAVKKKVNQLLKNTGYFNATKDAEDNDVMTIKPRMWYNALQERFSAADGEDEKIKALANKQKTIGGVKSFRLPPMSPQSIERLILAVMGNRAKNAKIKGVPLLWKNIAPSFAASYNLKKRWYHQLVVE